MTFQPILPLTGYSGWRFLENTLDKQQEAFASSQPVVRDTDYFRENIGSITTAEDLVNDRRLLSVALGAYGLDDDINNRFFIKKILEDGTTADDALANRLADNRYADFSEAFGFGDNAIPATLSEGFADKIISRYETRQFAQAVGEQDNDLRLALNVADGVSDILDRNSTNTGQWYSMMGNAPMRNVVQTALGLPSSTSSIDVDQQLEIYQERAKSVLGIDSFAQLAEPEAQEKLIRMFLIRSDAANMSASSGSSTALTLLQSVPQIY
ncbi:DUF1217 domain-containing protein [Loktanella sp. S4079]|uniref:DUF1217 domain-containing protein n=1 Tax=Loktanella sp. S4079 TaxID=579483 RepID=UPI0005FA2623|nr:DUF1217 domain-containing protein [Loktanella sp. S4079]KJZ21144.1 flagellar protein [Loktanella sp. S4079]